MHIRRLNINVCVSMAYMYILFTCCRTHAKFPNVVIFLLHQSLLTSQILLTEHGLVVCFTTYKSVVANILSYYFCVALGNFLITVKFY